MLKRIFSGAKSGAGLKGYVVWIPMLSGDSKSIAEEKSLDLAEEWVRHFWDGTKEGGASFGKMLGLSIPAWDVYLLYDKMVSWDLDKLPIPSLWQHQLSERDGAKQSRRLEASSFQQRVERSISS